MILNLTGLTINLHVFVYPLVYDLSCSSCNFCLSLILMSNAIEVGSVTVYAAVSVGTVINRNKKMNWKREHILAQKKKYIKFTHPFLLLRIPLVPVLFSLFLTFSLLHVFFVSIVPSQRCSSVSIVFIWLDWKGDHSCWLRFYSVDGVFSY